MPDTLNGILAVLVLWGVLAFIIASRLDRAQPKKDDPYIRTLENCIRYDTRAGHVLPPQDPPLSAAQRASFNLYFSAFLSAVFIAAIYGLAKMISG
jgi:hypothetical protein